MKKIIIFAACILSCAQAIAKPQHFFLIGSPGAGKGTFTQFLNRDGEYVHISLGDMLRAEITSGTDTGKQIKTKVEKGELINNNIVFTLFEEKFTTAIKNHKKIIVDGMLQSKEHIEFFDKLLAKYNLENDFNYVYLSIPKELALERLKSRLVCHHCNHVTNLVLIKEQKCPKCGTSIGKRLDDQLATINKRIERFHKNVVPLIQYYVHRAGFVAHDSAKEYNIRIAEYTESYITDGH